MKQFTEMPSTKRKRRYKAPKTAEPGHLWLLYDQWARSKGSRQETLWKDRFDRELKNRSR